MEFVEVQDVRVPGLGFGTWQPRGEACREGVHHALELGYRHIDTARMYRNAAEAGAGIADSDADRDEVFLVSKLPRGSLDRDSVARETEASLSELGADHVDLLLTHHPSHDVPLAGTLEAMRDFSLAQDERDRIAQLGR